MVWQDWIAIVYVPFSILVLGCVFLLQKKTLKLRQERIAYRIAQDIYKYKTNRAGNLDAATMRELLKACGIAEYHAQAPIKEPLEGKERPHGYGVLD